MANEEHLSILKQGVEAWNKWREDHPKIRPDLRSARLFMVNLRSTDFHATDLSGADLHQADLSQVALIDATLHGAYLRAVNLTGAKVHYADLRYADLRAANLTSTNFSGSDLSYADLRYVYFHDTYLHQATIGWTTFCDVDLGKVKGLDSVTYLGPSYIDIHTIYKSKGDIPEAFLRGAGIPDNFITYMKSLTDAAFDFYSCFISHSSQDKPFVERLYADLQAIGVRCWYAPEDLTIGEPFLLGIDKGIRLHDKLLLILSEHSVDSQWVEHEVLSAMGKSPGCLFPIRLDDAVINTSVPWATMIKQSRHIGNFTNWKDHDAYQRAFERLMRDLKTEGLKK